MSIQRKFKVGLIGTGGRCRSYANPYAKCPEMEIVAMADPSEQSRLDTVAQSGIKNKVSHYGDYRELLAKHNDLDGVVISTPNHLHRETAIPFIERGIPIALEKPIATTIGDAEMILDAARIHNTRILVGFVLRSTPYYRKIHEVLCGGEIGRILNVQADELVDREVSSIINRGGWRRYVRFSGGSMMEKSSHDLDMLNYLIGSHPVSMNCYGGSMFFRPNPNIPDTCDKCTLKNCQYAADRHWYLPKEELNLCIFNVDKDIADNQSVNIQYANGTIANFMLSFNCFGPRSGRNIHIVGTRGRLWGNIDEKSISVFDNQTEQTRKIEIEGGSGGHNGGDDSHAMELLRMMKEPGYVPQQDAYAGYLSSVMCIAADTSMREGRRLDFRYGAHGYIMLN